MRRFFGKWRSRIEPDKTGFGSLSTVTPQAESLLPPLVVEAERIGRQIRSGVHHQHRAGAGEDFWQYRPAHAHEPAHRIDWRQSARSDQLWVREREAEGAQQLALWCDQTESMNWHSSQRVPLKRDRAQLCTLALAAAALHGGERVSLLSGPEKGLSLSGPHSLPRLAQNLLTETPEALPTMDTLRPHGQLVLISDFLFDPAIVRQLLQDAVSRPARTQLFCVIDPAERSLPYQGPIQFRSLEAETSLTLPAVETLTGSYEQHMTAHLDQLVHLAETYHANLTIHHTDQPVLPALLALYARLTGGRMRA